METQVGLRVAKSIVPYIASVVLEPYFGVFYRFFAQGLSVFSENVVTIPCRPSDVLTYPAFACSINATLHRSIKHVACQILMV